MLGLVGCGPTTLASNGTQGHSSPSQSATASTSGTSQGGMTTSQSAGTSYSFRTLDDPADATFNQLLGFSNGGAIAGYFGSGAAGHPNKGYVLVRTPAGFRIHNENFPGSVQTQVTGLNDHGVTVGFWSDMNNANQTNDNFGFYDAGGSFHSVKFPTTSNANPPVNQLLGVNDEDVAVGFYTDAAGNSHGYTYRIFGGRFNNVTVPGATSVTAAAINNRDDVAGFSATAAGTTDGFLRTRGGHVYTLAYPGASMTQALGVNDFREVVGVYTVGSGNNAMTHGFTWTPKRGFKTVDDPQGVGATTINGLNDQGDLVGFYTDGAGNTDGFAAVPGGYTMLPAIIGTAMPAPSTSPSSSQSPSMAPTSTTAPTSSTTTAPPSTAPASSTAPMPSQSTQPSYQPSPSTAPTGNSSLTPPHW
ncbi:MAG TPA: hypothetical protein VF060_30385 [Trebonia sp.]